jgi:hypothetical protein
MSENHTPTPWQARGLHISMPVTPGQPHPYVVAKGPNARANIAFIVRACNAHADLVKALEAIASCESHHPDDVVAIARSALIKANQP